ncbi:MAG TPA: HAMP domain-containing sensor histidine kinase [Kofleriaceae bacterium]|nr:HAMP domain-containing sensor histidine kinase [Kofleriaceae bacterium]
MRSRRAWIYVLSVLALLVPAGGIAYLGAVSYRDERGAVSAQEERQRQAAIAIAGRIATAVQGALDAVDRGAPASDVPLARYGFSIDANGKLERPRPAHLTAPESSDDATRATCTRGLEDCVRELATRQARVAKLHAAQRAESRHDVAEAMRLYEQLAADDDTGPQALLGQARVHVAQGDPVAAKLLVARLDDRFADRKLDGLPVRLVGAVVLAGSDASAMLAIAEAVLAGRYGLDPAAQIGVVARLGDAIDRGKLPAPLGARRAALAERIAALRTEARMAAGLADDVPAIARETEAQWHGRPAARQPARTLIFRRRPDGGTSGLAVDDAMLEAAAGHEAADDVVADHVHTLVLPAGAKPPADLDLRALEQVPLVELPHLALALAIPRADPDPRDEVIGARSRRHVAFTSALAVALGFGLLLTIRGAARARELAQLKSDFVSTVSHELKTPLTSIRMFAEMLEQGVAKGDAAKMARYHGVIVQESHRLGLLIQNLLDYAQIERGTRRYTRMLEPIGPLARHAVTTFETLRAPEGSDGEASGARNPIELDVSSEAMTAEVLVDRDVVVQAVFNLLANAAKYGGADRPIEVAVGVDADAAWIAVRDHGPGIPAHEQPRIFREFYRAPEAYRSGVEGTGLGLALVKRHVEALGGTVAVESQLGQGATFTIRLPRRAEAAA